MNGYDEFYDLMRQEFFDWQDELREKQYERWCDYIDEQEEKAGADERLPWEEAVWGT